MMNKQELFRLQAKTPEQHFLNQMQQDFQYAPKIAQAILAEAKACLGSSAQTLRPGQTLAVVLKRDAPHGRALKETERIQVILTVDAGAEDATIAMREGRLALRRYRIQRLVTEALEQDGVLCQEDLARLLHVNVRTIKRDCAALTAQDIVVATRGSLQGIGRGQTHKAQIVKRWLRGETYDQIVIHSHHSVTSIKRYIQAFLRVVHLQQQGFSEEETSVLLQMSLYLVRDYLAVYAQNDTPFARQRLEEQLKRLQNRPQVGKKGEL